MNASQRARRRERRRERREKKLRDRLGYLLDFDRICDPHVLSHYAFECSKLVRWKYSTQLFMLKRLKNSITLSEQLKSGTYKPKEPHHFIQRERGKYRLISAGSFRDRVVSKAYCELFLIPLLYRNIVMDNSASQKGKGPDFARRRFELHMREGYRDYGKGAWMVSFDFVHFFASIDTEKAMAILEEAVRPLIVTERDAKEAEKLLNLGRLFICAEGEGLGLGLGNQTSQIMATIYASSLDHAIRKVCGCGYAGRYNDDGYVICRNKDEAAIVLGVVEVVAGQLGLRLHPNKSSMAPLIGVHTFLKTVYRMHEHGEITRTIAASSLKYNMRHYRAIAKRVAAGTLPYETLYQSEQSFGSLAQRTSNPEKTIRDMGKYHDKVKAELGLPLRYQASSSTCPFP